MSRLRNRLLASSASGVALLLVTSKKYFFGNSDKPPKRGDLPVFDRLLRSISLRVNCPYYENERSL